MSYYKTDDHINEQIVKALNDGIGFNFRTELAYIKSNLDEILPDDMVDLVFSYVYQNQKKSTVIEQKDIIRYIDAYNMKKRTAIRIGIRWNTERIQEYTKIIDIWFPNVVSGNHIRSIFKICKTSCKTVNSCS